MEPEPAAKDDEIGRELWDVSCTLVNLDTQYNPFEPEAGVL